MAGRLLNHLIWLETSLISELRRPIGLEFNVRFDALQKDFLLRCSELRTDLTEMMFACKGLKKRKRLSSAVFAHINCNSIYLKLW